MEIAGPNHDHPTSQINKHIFILSGQSNMAGRGGITKDRIWDSIIPPQNEPHPSILRFNANLQWEVARDPLHADIDINKPCGVGPGMSFANKMRGNHVVGLVPCAVGGTAIKEWGKGEELYENMVKRGKECVNGGGEIKGLIWYQGESDTAEQCDAEIYKVKMERLIMNVREDLGLPSLPVIQVAIASGDDRYTKIVRKAQLEMDLPNVICVDAKGLPLKEDNLHLTTEAQVQLGLMLASAYLKHFASPQPTSHA